VRQAVASRAMRASAKLSLGISMSMVKVITIPFQDSLQGFDDEKLSSFISTRRVLSLREFFFLKDGCPYLTFVICYESDFNQKQNIEQNKSFQKSDESWKNLLSDKDLPLFSILRDWRKTQAEKEGVPPYIVFTNRELAMLVNKKPQSKSQLGEIEGIGAKKIEKYGEHLLSMLKIMTNES
jgi:superfamily II DNA helicase RecQ